MPFRLLGLAVDPSQAGVLCGHTIRAYEASGVEVTVACGPDLGPHAIADLIERHVPHVLLVDGRHHGLLRAASIAFTLGRERLRGHGTLPAKLYSRVWPPLTPAVTTMVRGRPGAPELFIREQPAPWVTGVLERDLFAGLQGDSLARIESVAS